MLRIPCPHCGTRDYTEFKYFGDASKTHPDIDNNDIKTWTDFQFVFTNPKGEHREYWQHVGGCRQWLVLTRDTSTNTVVNVAWPEGVNRHG